jgi:hypothetical protein
MVLNSIYPKVMYYIKLLKFQRIKKYHKKVWAQLFLELGIIALAAGQPILVCCEEETLTTAWASLPNSLD